MKRMRSPYSRSLRRVNQQDVLNVFCKPQDFVPHVEDALVLRPSLVWFQSGLLELSAARRLLDAGIPVAEDCIGCRRASMWPSIEPFEAQRSAASSRTP
ncbi:CoA-binding protein [Sorangium sp. So ce363]|uniref:CoA-binding protein n=1 Tax=Sorangium sp. So ce363 TaxID=3133304 RepID=UPI003F62B93F